MSRATSDDQLKFLLSCVRHSNNGKIDFVEVARECGVVSKGAAAKRYERLLKANGIHPNGGSMERSTASAARPKSKAEIARSAAAKRRKIEGDASVFMNPEDDDQQPYVKVEPFHTTAIKDEPTEVLNIKSEPFNPGTGKLEPDTGFPHNELQRMAREPTQQQQAFFPRPSFSMHQFPMYNSIAQPFLQAYPPQYQQKFSLMLPMSVNSSQLRSSPSAMLQVQDPPSTISYSQAAPVPAHSAETALSSSESTTAIPEAEIQSMFDEFCAQNLIIPPEPDSSASTNTNIDASTDGKSQLSPHTVDAFAATSLDATIHPGTAASFVSDTITDTNTARGPSGSHINDSILITD